MILDLKLPEIHVHNNKRGILYDVVITVINTEVCSMKRPWFALLHPIQRPPTFIIYQRIISLWNCFDQCGFFMNHLQVFIFSVIDKYKVRIGWYLNACRFFENFKSLQLYSELVRQSHVECRWLSNLVQPFFVLKILHINFHSLEFNDSRVGTTELTNVQACLWSWKEKKQNAFYLFAYA